MFDNEDEKNAVFVITVLGVVFAFLYMFGAIS